MNIFEVMICCIAGIVALFLWAYWMDKRYGALLVAALVVWCFNMQPADAAPRGDENFPDISSWPMEPVLVGYNVFGQKIVLWANFCGGDGDGARRDHMHVYGIYNARGTFIQGGCWQFDPEFTRKTQRIKYFDLNGAGWDSWPLSGFHPARKTK